jgi:FkbM family methyltransferase
VSGSIRAVGRRLVKGAFQAAGLEIRWAVNAPNSVQGETSITDTPNKLSVGPVVGGGSSRPASFVLVASNHGTLIVNRNDYCTLDENHHFGVGFQILNTSCFDYDEVKLALALISKRMQAYGPGVVAIDCGANIGVHTVEWARQMPEWGTVIAIEPQERLFYALCGNIAINNCMNARAIWAAAGAKSGQMRIPVPDYEKPASFGSLELKRRDSTEFIGQKIEYSQDACVMVNVMSIDDLGLDRLDLIKIDVERMESEVLSGAEKTINLYRPLIIIEILKSDRNEITDFLRVHGYRYYAFAGNLIAVHENDPTAAGISASAGVLTVEPA